MSYRSAFIALAAIGAIVPLVGGCEDFNRAIGREKVVPDEFAVVSRAPLAIPPDFALRPPRIGVQRPQETSPVDQARQTVFRAGEDQQANLPPAADKRSPGEGQLLREAGAASAPADIRQLIDNEAQSANDMSDSFVDRLAFWRKDQKPGSLGAVIDPAQEAERLKGLKDAGKPASAPATAGIEGAPSIERTKPTSSWFGNLF